jgi:hypothetical protein
MRPWFLVFQGVKCVITGVFEAADDVGCSRYRCALARIGSDREARAETCEGVCSPRETVDSGLCFMVIKVILRGFFMFFEGKGGKWFRDGGGGGVAPHFGGRETTREISPARRAGRLV